jgi:hypothetical protein
MSKQATEPGVVEGGRLQKSLKMRRTTKVSLGDDTGAGLFRSNRQLSARSRRTCWGSGSHE